MRTEDKGLFLDESIKKPAPKPKKIRANTKQRKTQPKGNLFSFLIYVSYWIYCDLFDLF